VSLVKFNASRVLILTAAFVHSPAVAAEAAAARSAPSRTEHHDERRAAPAPVGVVRSHEAAVHRERVYSPGVVVVSPGCRIEIRSYTDGSGVMHSDRVTVCD
jgi:hypothetical protein